MSNCQTNRSRSLLISACKEKNPEALSVLYIQYKPYLTCFLKRKVSHRQWAEDVCQTVFLRILEGRCNYDGSKSVKSYLTGVARNVFKENSRKTIKQEKIINSLCHRFSHSHRNVPSETYDTGNEENYIKQRIKKLPPAQKEAIELTFFNGYSPRQAAEIANCSTSNFSARIYDAKRNLRTELTKF